MKKTTNLIIICLVAVLVLQAGIGSAYAYFTTYATAKGRVAIHLGESTIIDETVDNWTKHVRIGNNDTSSEYVYVRARAYSGSIYPLTYRETNGWSAGTDDWYYYAEPLAPGASSDVLDIVIGPVPEGTEPGDNFNVIVVYEATPVLYDAAGNPYADWNVVLTESLNEEE